MDINAGMVKELRERTGAGMMQCKKALAEASGDVEKAIESLRKMGLAQVAKRAERATAQGRIEAYIHAGNQIGVLIEVNCETDFVARTDDFINLCHELALQVAATSPRYVSTEEVPAELLNDHVQKTQQLLTGEGLTGADLEKRLAKETERFYEENVLLSQPNIRDGSRTMGEMVTTLAAKLGENLRVRRFSYFRLGGAS
jgi:elongation factor Ts